MQGRIERPHQFCSQIGIPHMLVVVTVITHEHHRVLPSPRLFVFYIRDGLINKDLRIVSRTNRESSNGNVMPIGTCRTAALTIIQTTEEAIVNIAIRLAERVLTLHAKQEIIRGVTLPRTRVHTVIPCTVAEEQQITRHLFIGLRPVVQHLHVTAVGMCIRSSAGEFIKQFISRHDLHRHSIALFMQRLDSFCLFTQFL